MSDSQKLCSANPTLNSSNISSSLPCRAAEHAEQIVKKCLVEAENVENVMRSMFNNAWNLYLDKHITDQNEFVKSVDNTGQTENQREVCGNTGGQCREEEEDFRVCHFTELPQWLKDNDYLVMGHRPPLSSFRACFWSIFRMHTETANIWTHGIGCLLFLGLAVHVFCCSQYSNISAMDKMVFGCFFAGAIICLGLSACYHTLSCHSHSVGRLFSKLDYCGISLLITGSFVPWLYYGFYCSLMPKVFYLCLTIFLGISSVIVSLWDKFSEPHFRPFRAGVFMAFGLSGVIPGIHWLISHGWTSWLESSIRASFTSLILMGLLYIIGALLYASRIPERFFPGKCDYWFHSHQLFHILVICAAVVHYHGITCMADYRLNSPNAVCEVGDQFMNY